MCNARNGLHIMEPFFLVEILDLETLTQEVAEGELGVAMVTPLGRRSFPLIRFNTNDIVRKGSRSCPCGRSSRMISEVVGRADDLCKIRGVLFTPVAVEELLRREFPEIGEFEVSVDCKGITDEISLKVEPCEETGIEKIKDLQDKLAERLKLKTNLRFNINCVATGELTRYTLKARRFKDLRKSK